ncbi:rab3 GTPase-activating protein non-catalytic subunit isoform X2 [Daktulosphaira vitifoliae]|uniref:rab3 GTPase-activating protein non-catalytic subunit isoform X2 n=1 Tax=Daktulosphaira vitifoliae TaxID=58002 RepID=UPI0021AA414D|nr:rab3 GTPase-activating protein non-catalytic subunit isoform X2 [Daktulosphaira vitifoliae]
MSIEFKAFAKGINHKRIKTFLFGTHDVNVNIFNDTVNCITPGGEILSFCYKDKIINFIIKYETNSSENICQQFEVLWSDVISANINEEITSVLCLPLSTVNTKLSSHSTPEWFCFAVGFSSGIVKFFNEDGNLLFSQIFHNNNVLKIRCQSHQPAMNNPPSIEQPEEFVVLYNDVLCTIVGTLLVNCLRSYKNQSVKGNYGSSTNIPALAYKKWAFDVQEKINDASVGGKYDIKSFQHVVAANICKGINGNKINNLPQITQIIAAGKNPYLAFHFSIGSQAIPTFENITKAVANKLKSSITQTLPSWLTYNLSSINNINFQETAEQLRCRFKLYDENCEALQIELSPQLAVGVISDNLNKVTLFEVNAGEIIRVWNDCREVQFGWLVVNESKSSNSKQALFLVMYLPFKESIEVWSMQNYELVSEIKVSKSGRLFYTNFGLLGALSSSRRNIYNANYRCYFIDETEIIRELIVPFHCADMSNNELSHDMHLMKTFKSLCRNENFDDKKLCEEVVNLANNLMTDKVRQQAFEYIKSSKHMTLNAFLDYLKSYKTVLEKEMTSNSLSKKIWLQTIDNHLKLIKYFTFLYQYQNKHSSSVLYTSSADDKTQELCKTLRISDQDLDKIISLVPFEIQRKTTVMFQDEIKLTFTKVIELLSCFKTTEDYITLRKDVNLDDLCKKIFEPIMHSDSDIREWNLAWVANGIQITDMMYLAVQYWLSKALTLTVVTEMISFYRIIDTLCNINVKENIDWKLIQDQFSNHSNTFSCLTGSIICKTIASIKKTELVKVDAEWECLTREDYKWNLLIVRLEQVCHLNATLKYCPEESHSTLYCTKYNHIPLSLTEVLRNGRGGVSMFVAKWLISVGLDPALIMNDYLFDKQDKILEIESPNLENKIVKSIQDGIAINTELAIEARTLSNAEKETIDALQNLRLCFPYSLDSNILLSNIYWEYLLEWKECVSNLRPLEAGLKVADYIACSHIKYSISNLIWITFLSSTFESAVKLIHQLGKIPKEKLCIQDVGMPDRCISKFFNLCEYFLDSVIKALLSAEDDILAEIKHDLFWENWKINNQHEPTLVQKALSIPNPDQEVLLFFHQCARTFHIMSEFSLHSSKPLTNLFDCNINEVDFHSLNHKNYLTQEQPRLKVKKARTDFIMNSITSAIGLIQKDYECDHYEFDSKEYLFWMSKITQLSIDWELSLDELRIHQVVSLYAKGHDRLAGEVVPIVSNKESLVKQLLNIIKHRLKYELTMNDLDFYRKIVHFSPEMILWLNDPVSMEVEKSLITETLELVQTVVTLISENDVQYDFAISLMNSLISFNDS